MPISARPTAVCEPRSLPDILGYLRLNSGPERSGDALVLANILRTDLAAHRPLPADSELAASIQVLARAQ